MKLNFLLQKNAWFVEHGRSWYAIRDEEQVRLAASTLPLIVVDQHSLIAQPHIGGAAVLHWETQTVSARRFARRARAAEVGVIRVALSEPDGTLVAEERIVLDVDALGSMEWITPPFRDGWVDSVTSIALDNVDHLELEAFLPDVPGSSGKKLIVRNETDDTTSEVWLERRRKNVVPLMSKGRRGKVVLHLECEPEATDEAKDPRRLGFVLLGKSLKAA